MEQISFKRAVSNNSEYSSGVEIFDMEKGIPDNFEGEREFKEFSDYEWKTLSRKKPKSSKTFKLMRALVLGTFLIGSSVGCIAIEAKPAEAQELTNKNEKKEQLRTLVSGIIDGKVRFEIKTMVDRATLYNYPTDKKYFKIFVDGKETNIIMMDQYMDGGSKIIYTDMGSFFIPHPLARDPITLKKAEPHFGASDGKNHTIEIEVNNMFNK